MAWSTREIADLAGTTVNTVRHYHRLGILEQPERMSNGYKQYQVSHLIRLLKIRRLRDLGAPLDQIADLTLEGGSASGALQAIDADLVAKIGQSQRARAEIQAILHGSSVTGVPAGFSDVGHLSDQDQSLMLISSRLYDDAAMQDMQKVASTHPDAASKEFDDLAPDADHVVRKDLAERYALTLMKLMGDHPSLKDPTKHLLKSLEVTQNTLLESIMAVYNDAQRDVLARAIVIASDFSAEGRVMEGEPTD